VTRTMTTTVTTTSCLRLDAGPDIITTDTDDTDTTDTATDDLGAEQ
jgi:hypothetical protein